MYTEGSEVNRTENFPFTQYGFGLNSSITLRHVLLHWMAKANSPINSLLRDNCGEKKL